MGGATMKGIRMFRWSTCLVSALLLSAGAAAQSYPTKPLRIVVGYAPGGTTDLLARMLAKQLAQTWGHSVVVENRAGGGGVIGTDIVAKANPDGYTILMSAPAPITINPHLMGALPYDPLKDFAPITLIATTPSLLVINPAVQAKSVSELVKLAKSVKGGMNYASTGNGSPSHLMGVLFERAAGVRMEHIAYKGTGPAITDLLGGHVQVMFNTIPAILPIVRAGRLNALAITSPKRFDGLPEVPTMTEAGFGTIESGGWYGVLVPAKTPAAVSKILHTAVSDALRASEIQDVLRREGANIVADSPAQFSAFIQRDSQKWKKVVEDAKIKLD